MFELLKSLPEFSDRSGVDPYHSPRFNDLDKSEKAAMIFIHGFRGDKKSTWGKTFEFLREEPKFDMWDIYSYGYNSSIKPDWGKKIWSAEASITELGAAFMNELQVRINQGYRSLSIYAHSMGGLVTQVAILGLSKASRARLDNVIMFGTPSNGLIKAWLGILINNQFRDMSYKSKFIRNLRKKWSSEINDKYPFSFKAVRGANDEFVPEESATDVFIKNETNVIGGNHVRIVKPKSPEDPIINIIKNSLLVNANYKYKWDPTSLAFERSHFSSVIAICENIPFEELTYDSQINYILALEEKGSCLLYTSDAADE